MVTNNVGIFLYRDDTQETDIEYLTDPKSSANNVNQSSINGDPIPIWYSNQALLPGTIATQEIGPAPDTYTEFHEYRIDWSDKQTAFYIDNELQKRLTQNVPDKSGPWIWNNWANGDIGKQRSTNLHCILTTTGWSCGPPVEDSFFKIKNITMYYNTDNSDPAKR